MSPVYVKIKSGENVNVQNFCEVETMHKPWPAQHTASNSSLYLSWTRLVLQPVFHMHVSHVTVIIHCQQVLTAILQSSSGHNTQCTNIKLLNGSLSIGMVWCADDVTRVREGATVDDVGRLLDLRFSVGRRISGGGVVQVHGCSDRCRDLDWLGHWHSRFL